MRTKNFKKNLSRIRLYSERKRSESQQRDREVVKVFVEKLNDKDSSSIELEMQRKDFWNEIS
jgi:hypothetical protein